ncbi:MAG: 16S rRNA (guanine(527)-N(7))-methyltransferase RsmG [Paracoccus sp. (in: a-proteobacteria)]|uniref:16S rRNA (guanine(527)-N(7))-methyltransferase RsmG n=1 Tax=Paracoccus sp. TaxID=267 RepID=UPI0039E5737F
MIVSRETEKLRGYAQLLRKWNPAINLVAPSTLQDLEIRHIEDSLGLSEIASKAQGPWLDIGSGGGLPGIVLGIMRQDLPITLMESDKRKCSFLRTAIRELALSNIQVLNARIEEATPQNVANVSARALAPMPLLLSYVSRHSAKDGRAWIMKGRNWQKEVVEARTFWSFDYIPHESRLEPGAAILEITGLNHA